MDLERPDSDVLVRTLTRADADRLVRIDERITGRRRARWYEGRLSRALADSDLNVSLGAELDGSLVGAILGTLQYGEFGRPEPTAVLDTILVDPSFAGRGVGRALMEQLVRNLRALHIDKIRTEVDWQERDLIAFLGHAGFTPVPRLVLELPLS